MLCIPLVHEGHLTEEGRDSAFWHSFHPDDRRALVPRLIALHPFQPLDIPFLFEDVFRCAKGAFAYEEPHTFWPQE